MTAMVSPIFDDRDDAARALAQMVVNEAGFGGGPVFLGVAPGGFPIAQHLADAVGGELDIVVAHRIGIPWRPEVAIAAVTSDGAVVSTMSSSAAPTSNSLNCPPPCRTNALPQHGAHPGVGASCGVEAHRQTGHRGHRRRRPSADGDRARRTTQRPPAASIPPDLRRAGLQRRSGSRAARRGRRRALGATVGPVPISPPLLPHLAIITDNDIRDALTAGQR
jgi:hypothetical protein